MPKGLKVSRTSPVHQVRFSDEENASPLEVDIEEGPDEEEEEEKEGDREEPEEVDVGLPRTPPLVPPGGTPLVVPPTHPSRLSSLPPPPPGLSSSLAAMYSARLGSDADYLRYKACKDSAESFYSRLATLSALHSYGYYLHPLTLPSLMSQYQQRLQPNPQPHPPHPPSSMAFNGNLSPCSTSSNNSLSSPISLANQNGLNTTTSSTLSSHSNHSNRGSVKRKPLEDSANHSTPTNTLSPVSSTPIPNKKAKVSPLPKRKVSRKLAFDDFKTSPVSGTLIRELAEGEEVPAIRKGKLSNIICFT